MPAEPLARRPGGLFRSPLSRWGAALILLMALAALLAPWIAPLPPTQQLDPAAGRYLPPGSSRLAVALADGRLLLVERVEEAAEGLRLERRGRSESVPSERLEPDAAPRRVRFGLGTDGLGRDVWSRILHGGRVSLTIGVLSALLALTLGVAVGGLAGAGGGALDAAIMRLVDALLAFPRLFLVIAVAALFEAGPWLVILVLGGTGWMSASRLVRAEIRTLKSREFVLAAQAVGQRPFRVFLRHLLPNALTPLIVHTALRVGEMILLEAALSFLGLGVQPPDPSWGNMVADGAEALTGAWWVSTFPGLAIALTVLAFSLLADGLRDELDPRVAS